MYHGSVGIVYVRMTLPKYCLFDWGEVNAATVLCSLFHDLACCVCLFSGHYSSGLLLDSGRLFWLK